MNLLISGSRKGFDQIDIDEYCMSICNNKPYEISSIIHGGAKGVDEYFANFAKRYQIKQTILIPEWDKYGKSAGMIRNKEMLNLVLTLENPCFLGMCYQKSKGTTNMIKLVEDHKSHFEKYYIVERT